MYECCTDHSIKAPDEDEITNINFAYQMTIAQRQGDTRAKIGRCTMQCHIRQQAALSKSFLMYLQNLLVTWMLRIKLMSSLVQLNWV